MYYHIYRDREDRYWFACDADGGILTYRSKIDLSLDVLGTLAIINATKLREIRLKAAEAEAALGVPYKFGPISSYEVRFLGGPNMVESQIYGALLGDQIAAAELYKRAKSPL